jgi:ribosomal protein S18 acetylase RimI-like enzyme
MSNTAIAIARRWTRLAVRAANGGRSGGTSLGFAMPGRLSHNGADAGRGEANSMRQVTIRDMTIDDYEAVTRVWTEAALPFRPRGRDRREKMQAEMARGTALFLVAEAGGEVVGVVLGTHDGRRGWINRLAVLPAYQRQGIARRLVREIEARTDALGIGIVAALVESDNEASLAFFRQIEYAHSPEVEYVSKRRSADT